MEHAFCHVPSLALAGVTAPVMRVTQILLAGAILVLDTTPATKACRQDHGVGEDGHPNQWSVHNERAMERLGYFANGKKEERSNVFI
jgi:hypothetical protein